MVSQDFTESMFGAWREAGSRPPATPSSQMRASCVAPGCTGLAFAEITTAAGQQALCWKHFEAMNVRVGHRWNNKETP
jgi:hypothetical protein